ncbi:MAG: DUF420 domain-containing protein [Chitinophagaceae bacterium]|nr:DUF420 domain-containing protein [Chitinophagaceae bacterium]MCW5904698.1 DUF420 domain-containing protein [Chitinophagaceae bacterium]
MQPSIQKNDKKAAWIIGIFSFVAFAVIASLGGIHLKVDVGFDIHIFATINACINSVIAVILIAAVIAVKNKKYYLHKKLMIAALLLSVLFLISYVAHHLLAGDTKFGGTGFLRAFYFFILITHIFLASVILPFILFTAYRGLTAEFDKHKKIAKITFPLWLYVAITGPIIYLLISPYY